jgi:hypothetical protein
MKTSRPSFLLGQNVKLDIGLAVMIALGAFAMHLAPSTCDASAACNNYAKTKPYKTFEAFYPFYLTQHQNQTCRRLHFVGTSIVILILCMDLSIGLSMAHAALWGLAAFTVTRSLENGLVEALVTVAVFLLTYRRLSKSITKSAMVLLVGYGFAWVGHFFFEKNRPATFIYPCFSLGSDFKMWYEIASRQRPF